MKKSHLKMDAFWRLDFFLLGLRDELNLGGPASWQVFLFVLGESSSPLKKNASHTPFQKKTTSMHEISSLHGAAF